jgi:cobaltochelatase CobS
MGDGTQLHDSKGRPKVKCGMCGLYCHRVDKHAFEKHGLSPAEYRERFPGLELMSPAARTIFRRASVVAKDDGSTAEAPSAPSSDEPLKFGVARLRERKLDSADQAFVPLHDEGWVPGDIEKNNLEYLALGAQDDENVLVVGPPGIGKTSMVRQLAVLCNQPLRRLPFNGELRVSDLVGSKELIVDPTSGQTITKWVNGPLVDAAERGHWALFDEFDAAPPPTSFIFHSLLERPRQLTLMARDGGKEVCFHKWFRVFATANTLGYGDDSGLYAGTAPMNEALLDRFGIVVRLDYPEPDAEMEILTKRTGITAGHAQKMVEIAAKVREAQRNQSTMVSLSPRRLVAWASKTVRLGSVNRAAQITVLNKLPHDDEVFVRGIIQRHFAGSGLL